MAETMCCKILTVENTKSSFSRIGQGTKQHSDSAGSLNLLNNLIMIVIRAKIMSRLVLVTLRSDSPGSYCCSCDKVTDKA